MTDVPHIGHETVCGDLIQSLSHPDLDLALANGGDQTLDHS